MTSLSEAELNDFKVLGKLGEGGFGQVFKVLHKVDKQEYALKQIRCKCLQEVSTAFQEIILHNSSKSKGVTKISYYYIRSREPAKYEIGMIMQLGICSLDHFIKWSRVKRQRPAPHLLQHILFQLVRTLSQLQAQKLYHRDIKPANIILFDKEGKIVKLTDFGLSRYQTNEYDHRKAGSLDYASPQLRLLLQDRKCTLMYSVPKSDVYSLGMTFLQAASLIDLKVSGLNKQSNQKQLSKIIQSMSIHNKGCWLPQILQKMLCFEQSKRPYFKDLMKMIEQFNSQQEEPSFDFGILQPQTTAVDQKTANHILIQSHTHLPKKTSFTTSRDSLVHCQVGDSVALGEQSGRIFFNGKLLFNCKSKISYILHDQQKLYCATQELIILVWNLNDLKAGYSRIDLSKHDCQLGISCLCFLDKCLYVGFLSGRILNINQNIKIKTHDGRITSMNKTSARNLITAGDDGMAFLINKKLEVIFSKKISNSPIIQSTFLSQFNRLFVGTAQGQLKQFTLCQQTDKDTCSILLDYQDQRKGWVSDISCSKGSIMVLWSSGILVQIQPGKNQVHRREIQLEKGTRKEQAIRAWQEQGVIQVRFIRN